MDSVTRAKWALAGAWLKRDDEDAWSIASDAIQEIGGDDKMWSVYRTLRGIAAASRVTGQVPNFNLDVLLGGA